MREEIEGRWGSSEELSLLSGGASRGRRWGSRRGRWRREGEIDVRGFSLAAVDERGSEGRCEGIGLGLG